MRVFEFRSDWRLDADVARVYTALADVDNYPRWWPQVRSIRRIDAQTGVAFVRSILPYELELSLTREVEDPVAHVLRVRIDGDLEGWSEWRVDAVSAGRQPATVARYRQEATVATAGVSRLLPVTAPVLRANHTWMMRSGERGLREYLRR